MTKQVEDMRLVDGFKKHLEELSRSADTGGKHLEDTRRLVDKGTHLTQTTKARILEIWAAPGEKPPSASKIIEQLKKDNAAGAKYTIPASERTIQTFLKKIREHETEAMRIGNLPWSLGIMAQADTGIPWEAAPFLLQCREDLLLLARDEKGADKPEPTSPEITYEHIKELIELRKEEELQHISETPFFFVETIPPVPTEAFSVRQAKWLWNISLARPLLGSREYSPALFRIAYDYALRALIADYLNRDFDTSIMDVYSLRVNKEFRETALAKLKARRETADIGR